MADVIKTPFDDPISEDVTLEQTENETMPYDQLLANAENILKSFLYLKDLYSSAPVFNKIVKIQKFEGANDTPVEIDTEANLVTIKNLSDSVSEVKYNDNEPLVLFQYEQVDIPIFSGDTIQLNGDFNVIQIKYEVR